MGRFVVFSEMDNVAVALEPLSRGQLAELPGGETVEAVDSIPFGHKIAISSIKPGESVRKYGEVIGAATAEIRKGEHVHVHNIRSLRVRVTE